MKVRNLNLTLKLSDVLVKENNKQMVTKDKVSLPYKHIMYLNSPVTKPFTLIKKLFLSHNEIQNLDGIEKFKNLTHLSLAFNKIFEIEELRKIGQLPHLQSISFRGNFIEKHPDIAYLLLSHHPKQVLPIIIQFERNRRCCNNLELHKVAEMQANLLLILLDLPILKKKLIPFLYQIQLKILRYSDELQKLETYFHDPSSHDSLKTAQFERVFGKIQRYLDIKDFKNKPGNITADQLCNLIKEIEPNCEDNFKPKSREEIGQAFKYIFKEILLILNYKKNNELIRYLNLKILQKNPEILNNLECQTDQIFEMKQESIQFAVEYMLSDKMLDKQKILQAQIEQFYFLQPQQASILDQRFFQNFSEGNDLFLQSSDEEFMQSISSPIDQTNPFAAALEKKVEIHPSDSIPNQTRGNNRILKLGDLTAEPEQKQPFHDMYLMNEFPMFIFNPDYMRAITYIVMGKVDQILNLFNQGSNFIKRLVIMQNKKMGNNTSFNDGEQNSFLEAQSYIAKPLAVRQTQNSFISNQNNNNTVGQSIKKYAQQFGKRLSFKEQNTLLNLSLVRQKITDVHKMQNGLYQLRENKNFLNKIEMGAQLLKQAFNSKTKTAMDCLYSNYREGVDTSNFHYDVTLKLRVLRSLDLALKIQDNKCYKAYMYYEEQLKIKAFYQIASLVIKKKQKQEVLEKLENQWNQDKRKIYFRQWRKEYIERAKMLLKKDQQCLKFKVKYSDFCKCPDCHYDKRRVDIKPILDKKVIETEPVRNYIFTEYEPAVDRDLVKRTLKPFVTNMSSRMTTNQWDNKTYEDFGTMETEQLESFMTHRKKRLEKENRSQNRHYMKTTESFVSKKRDTFY